MSPREKKLLIFFATAGFIMVNFMLFGFLKSQKGKYDLQLGQAQRKLDTANMISESRDQVEDEMNWLSEHEPDPAADQDVQTKLQQLCEREAKNVGLTIKSQKPLETDATEGKNYHRARFQFTVNGAEDALYKWFYALNAPDQFRIASNIKLSPNKEDDTKIDCVATIEQWFLPISAEDAAADSEAGSSDAGSGEETQ